MASTWRRAAHVASTWRLGLFRCEGCWVATPRSALIGEAVFGYERATIGESYPRAVRESQPRMNHDTARGAQRVARALARGRGSRTGCLRGAGHARTWALDDGPPYYSVIIYGPCTVSLYMTSLQRKKMAYSTVSLRPCRVPVAVDAAGAPRRVAGTLCRCAASAPAPR